jgi:hypothetical protein
MMADRTTRDYKPGAGTLTSGQSMDAAGSPGKRTLVDAAFTRASSVPARAATGHPAATSRIAERDRADLNAVLKVVAYDDHGSVLRSWGARARWDGPLPQHFHGSHVGARWDWDDATSARTVRIHAHGDGTGGEAIEAWAGRLHAARVEIFAEPTEAVAKRNESSDDARDPNAPGAGHDVQNTHGNVASDDGHRARGDGGTRHAKDHSGPTDQPGVALHAPRQGSLQIGWQCAGVPGGLFPARPQERSAGNGDAQGDAECGCSGSVLRGSRWPVSRAGARAWSAARGVRSIVKPLSVSGT